MSGKDSKDKDCAEGLVEALEMIISTAENPTVNSLETGFRHSPLTQKEIVERLTLACEEVIRCARTALDRHATADCEGVTMMGVPLTAEQEADIRAAADALAIPQGEARARIGGRVPEHVYLDGKPLFTAASAEQAAEVVTLLNATLQGAGETAGGGLPKLPDGWTYVRNEVGELRVQHPPGMIGEPHADIATAAAEQAGSRGVEPTMSWDDLADLGCGHPGVRRRTGPTDEPPAAARPHSDAKSNFSESDLAQARTWLDGSYGETCKRIAEALLTAK